MHCFCPNGASIPSKCCSFENVHTKVYLLLLESTEVAQSVYSLCDKFKFNSCQKLTILPRVHMKK